MPAEKVVGLLSLKLNAATSELILGLKESKAKVIDFGEAVKRTSATTISATQAANTSIKATGIESNAVVRALEGNLSSSTRAVSRFLSVTLGLGPALAAAFNVVAPLLLAKVIYDVGERIAKFYKDSQQAPAKMAEAFRQINTPLKLTNDELRVANDRLDNEIAKLEGKRSNNLALELDETRVIADKLANSLGKDLEELEKLFKERSIGTLKGLFTDTAPTTEQQDRLDKFIESLRAIEDKGTESVRSAKTPAQAKEAQTQLNTVAIAAIDKEILAERKLLQSVKDVQVAREAQQKAPDRGGYLGGFLPADQSVVINAYRGTIEQLSEIRDKYLLSSAEAQKTATVEGLRSNKENEQTALNNKLAELRARLEGVKGELSAIGQDDSAQRQAKATAEALQDIAKIEDDLKAKGKTPLQAPDKDFILYLHTAIDEARHQVELAKAVDEITRKLNAEAVGYRDLAAAVGQSYEATKQANIEAKVAKDLAEKNIKPGDVGYAGAAVSIRAAQTGLVEGQHTEEIAKESFALSEQTAMQERLIQAQQLGEQEVRRLEVQEIIHQAYLKGTTELIGLQIKALLDKYRLPISENIAKLNAETEANKRLAAAETLGAEAARKQALENKYLELQRTGQGGKIPAERLTDESSNQLKITEAVTKTVNEYKNHLEQLDIEEAKIKEIYGIYFQTADEVRALKEIENDRLKVLVQQSLAIGKASDGVRAFFLEMQEEAKKSGEIIYEALNSALDRLSDQFAKFLTGQKTSFGKVFKSLGEETLKSSIKSAAQIGLGQLGKVFGITGKPDGSSEEKALWVRLALNNLALAQLGPHRPSLGVPDTDSEGNPFPGAVGAIGGAIGGAASAGFSFLKSLFTSAGTPSVTSTFIPGLAGGGDTTAGLPYIVGERGPEIRQFSRSGSIVPLGQGGGRGGDTYIDARGSDLGVLNRINQAMGITRDSAVSTSVRAQYERQRRVPQRSNR